MGLDRGRARLPEEISDGERFFRDVRAGMNHPLSNARARELIGKSALGIGLGEVPRW